jgi:hypothetical protein
VAQNITEGKGSTFDGINPTNGYHPLWMIICIPIFFLARYDLILPLRILIMVMAVFNLATAIMIYRYLKENLSDPVAMMASMFWLFNAYIHYTLYEYGLESPVAAFAVVLFIYKLSHFEKKWRHHPVTAAEIAQLALIAVLVMFSRLDLIFLVLIAGIWVVFRNKAIRFFAPLDIVIIFLSMTSAVALRTDIPTYNNEYATATIQVTVIALAAKMIFLYLFGAYQNPRVHRFIKTVQKTLLALVCGSITTATVYWIVNQAGAIETLPRTAFLVDFLISSVLVVALRLAAYRLGRTKEIKETAPIPTLQLNWKAWATEGTIYYGIIGGALSLYMLVNKLLFGTTSPVSGQIKRWWGTLGETVYEHPPENWRTFLGIGYKGPYDAWQPMSTFFDWLAGYTRPFYPGANMQDERYYMVMAVFSILVFTILFINAKRVRNKITSMALLPLIAGCGVHILSYTTTAYGGAKEWYWVSQMVLTVFAGSFFLQLVLSPLRNFMYTKSVLQVTAIVVGIFLASQQANYFSGVMLYNYYPADKPYMDVVPYLEANTPSGSVIGMTGGGNVGYFIKDRTIVNMDGLISSYEYFQELKAGNAPEYLHKHKVQVIFASSSLLNYPPYNGQFARFLEAYSVYGGKSLMYLLDEPKY